MGNKQTKPIDAGASTAGSRTFNWPAAPDGPSEAELERMDELVLQTWASCKAKPVDAKLFRSDVDEKQRREGIAWRKRPSFVELDCGEDSFFVANTYRTVGVADGVAGWRNEGVDPTLFPNELMKNAKHFAETHRRTLDPEAIMENAFGKLKHDKQVPAGSSTACVASLVEKGDSAEDGTAGGVAAAAATGWLPDALRAGPRHFLDIANLGDAGCIVIRNHDIVYRVHEKVHAFNSPLQLAVLPPGYEKKCYNDTPSDAVREQFEVRKGDVVVLGTDGLFDNRFCSQIAMEAAWVGDTEQKSAYDGIPVIGKVLKMVTGPKHQARYTDPYRVVQRVCQDAYKTAMNGKADTPWAESLRMCGVEHAQGGKVDDVTVLISKITTRRELMETTMW